MTILPFFTNPHRVRSQELTALARKAEDEGDLAAELAHWAEAARLEEENVQEAPIPGRPV